MAGKKKKGKKGVVQRAKQGIGSLKRHLDNSIAATAPAIGIALREAGGSSSYRERGSMMMQRYVGVGLDGSLDVGQAMNSWMGIGHRWIHQKVASRVGFYRMVSNRKALPILAESMPILFAMDAGAGITDATDKLQAWHKCYNETLDGYDPESGVYDGFANPKNAAFSLAELGAFVGSKAVSEMAPSVNESISKFTGGFVRGL